MPIKQPPKNTSSEVVTFIIVTVVVLLVVGQSGKVWNWYASTRSAVVRAVFLHPGGRNSFPQIYMNDGTVWELADNEENVYMLKGDKVRYVYRPNTLWPGMDDCTLNDITTGYKTPATRLSAPFKHSSCPQGSAR